MLTRRCKTIFYKNTLLILLCLVISACLKEKAPEQKVELPVTVYTLKVEPAYKEEQYKYAGEISPRKESALAFRIGGKILSRAVDVGTKVKQGAEIARLDAKDIRLETDAVSAQVQAAQADHDLAKADLARYKELLDKNFISKAEFERRSNTVAVTTANKNGLKSRLNATHNQVRYTVLRADTDGVVTAVVAQPGEVVNAGQAIVHIARTDEVEAVISVPENRLSEVKRAKEVEITLWSNPDQRYDGQVREVSPIADPGTRTYQVRISIRQPDEFVSLGMTASVTLIGENLRQIYVPVSALYHQQDQVAVWVVDPKIMEVSLLPIGVSTFERDLVVVSSGLNGGEYIVTKGVHKLHADQKVRFLE